MAKAKILIVEDESIVARDIQRRLLHLGYEVVGAVPTGEEAIKKASILLPDLVLMDVRLKGEMDGIEAASVIRQEYGIPVIYLSAYADNDTLKRASVTEPFGYILKPFEERELHTTIEMALYRNELEKKIKERENWYGTTLRSLGEAVIATDTEGRIDFMNTTAEALTGWKFQEAQGKDLLLVFKTVEQSGKRGGKNPVEQILTNRVTAVLKNHATLISRDGREIPIDESASPIKDDRGNIVGAVLVFQDVSERKRAQEALRASQEYAENIINSSMDMIIAVDLDRRIIEFNKAAENTFGYKKEEVLGKHINILYADEEVSNNVNTLISKQGHGVLEVLNKRKNGEVFPCLLSSSVLKNARGEKIGYMGVSRDITEIKRAEEKLKAAQEYAQNIIQSSLDMIIAVDRDRSIVEFNRAAEETFGYSAKEVLGKPYDFLFEKPEDGVRVYETTVIQGRFVGEVTNRRKNGEVFSSLLSSSVLKNTEGKSIGVMGVSRDITDMKKAQEALRESEERYRAIVELLPDPIAVHIDNKIVFVNSAAVKAFGAETPDELLGRNVLDIVHPDYKVIVSERIRQMQEGQVVPKIEEKFLRADGTIFEAEVIAMPFLWHGHRAIQVVMRDLSERKKADQAIRASEAKYRSLFENVLDGVYQTTPDGEILTANPAFAHMLGYESEADLLLINVEDIYVNKEERRHFLETLERDGRVINAEQTLKRKDGKIITVLENARVVRNKAGEILFFEGTIRDITELKNIQLALRKSEERFRAFARQSSEAIWTLECEPPIRLQSTPALNIEQFIANAVLSECNDVCARMHGYSVAKDLIGKPLKELITTSEIFTIEIFEHFFSSEYSVEELETHGYDTFGNDRYLVHNLIGIIENDRLVRVWGTALNATEEKRNKLMSGIAYRIARTTEMQNTLEGIFADVHSILQDAMGAKNFYIALFDKNYESISFPYYVDEINPCEETRKLGKGPLDYVLRTGKTLVLKPETMAQIEENEGLQFTGVKPRSWLGVPMVVGKTVIGAMVTQSYSDTQVYTEQHRHIMKFVSAQISKAIDYKRTLMALRGKEYLYQRFFEHSSIPLFIADSEGALVEGNVSFWKLFNKKPEEAQTLLSERIYIGSEKDRKKLIEELYLERNLENYIIHIAIPGHKSKQVRALMIGTFDQQGKLEYIHGQIIGS